MCGVSGTGEVLGERRGGGTTATVQDSRSRGWIDGRRAGERSMKNGENERESMGCMEGEGVETEEEIKRNQSEERGRGEDRTMKQSERVTQRGREEERQATDESQKKIQILEGKFFFKDNKVNLQDLCV